MCVLALPRKVQHIVQLGTNILVIFSQSFLFVVDLEGGFWHYLSPAASLLEVACILVLSGVHMVAKDTIHCFLVL